MGIIHKSDHSQGTWPTFLIIGGGRSGKIALCDYLSQHPEVFISNPQEPNFFSAVNADIGYTSKDHLYYDNIITDVVSYQELFQNTGQFTALGEASGDYLLFPSETIRNIKLLVPDSRNLKIIIILRDPTARAFSAHTHYQMHGFEVLSFDEAVSANTIGKRLKENWSINYDYLRGGLYADAVAQFLSEFPNAMVILSSDLLSDSQGVLPEIFQFLEVGDDFFPTIATNINISGKSRSRILFAMLYDENNRFRRFIRRILNPVLPHKTRKWLKNYLRGLILHKARMKQDSRTRLIEYYRKDIRALEKLIDRDLSEWLT